MFIYIYYFSFLTEHAAEEAEALVAVVQVIFEIEWIVIDFFFEYTFCSVKETTKEGDDEDEDKPKKPATTGGKGKKLTNQFNFSERASQTYNNPCRVNIRT